MSTRQLAATLTKTAPAPGQATQMNTPEAGKAPDAAARETAATPKGEEEQKPAPESEIETPPAETAPVETPPVETAAEQTPAAETPPEEIPVEHADAPSGEAPALPAEIVEAMEIAKAQDGGKGKADLLKRVYKLVDQRDTERNARLAAEETNRKLAGQLEAAGKNPEAATVTASSGVHPAVAELVGELTNVDHWLGWCKQHAEGGEVPDGKGGSVKLNAANVGQIYDDLTNQRSELVARKVQTQSAVKQAFTDTYRQVHAAAVVRYPWVAKPEAAEHVRMQALLKQMPGLKQFPDYELVVGDYFRGEQARMADEKARAAGKINGQPARREPARVAIAPAATGAEEAKPAAKAIQETESKFQKSGRTADLAKSFSARARANRVKK
jgi:hypothetical protein